MIICTKQKLTAILQSLLILITLIFISCGSGSKDNSNDKNITTNDSLILSDTLRKDTAAGNFIKDTTPQVNIANNIKNNETIPLRDFGKEGFTKAIVKNYSGLDGCSFMLLLESGKKLEPKNLEKEYYIDGKKVWIKYTPVSFISICMSGETVNIDAIEPRNEN